MKARNYLKALKDYKDVVEATERFQQIGESYVNLVLGIANNFRRQKQLWQDLVRVHKLTKQTDQPDQTDQTDQTASWRAERMLQFLL